MTRIAIVSDIHGNIYALEAVLEDMKEKAIDSVYCLGDMIGIGPFSNEVLEALFAMDNMQMITGNHEESILAILTNNPYPKSRISVKPHHEWIANRLKNEFIEEISKLPRQISKAFDGHSLQFIHYPMNPSSSNAPISQDPFDQLGMPSVENFANIQGLETTDLVCFGHDHSHHLFSCNNTAFYNTGSLGYSSKAFARYGIIEVDRNGYHISQINVPYDLEKYVHDLTNSSVPRKEIILRMYS